MRELHCGNCQQHGRRLSLRNVNSVDLIEFSASNQGNNHEFLIKIKLDDTLKVKRAEKRDRFSVELANMSTTLNLSSSDYFSMLLHADKRSHAALEMLVDDLHADKERTISKFLCHSGSEDFLWGLVRLLGSQNSRVAGNAAYILGTLAESELGCFRVISLTNSRPEGHNILKDLTNMLTFDDSESVMNAAGTMGTLAESAEGRTWMLQESCLSTTLQHVTNLLNSDNMWTASNAALVLARLTIAEEGCHKLLNHENTKNILSKLILSLGVDEAGRGMNAAFAIGRLCDLEEGRNQLLELPDSEKMITSLAKMLCCNDMGASKNACFALSCLATNKDGHSRILKNVHSEEVLQTLALLLSADDSETGWFAAMTLRTLASQPKGCLRLRETPDVLAALKAVESRNQISSDLKEEVQHTLEILKKLEKPSPPEIEVLGAHEVSATWTAVTTKSGFTVKYQLLEGGHNVYYGTDANCVVKTLQPYTQYSFRLRVCTTGDESIPSDPVVITTEEAVPGEPQELRVLGSTTTQLKIGWEPPEFPNGILKGYYVYNGEKLVEHTHEHSCIISGLVPNSSYEIQVCAATAKGKGPRESVIGTTTELGAHAPSKPSITVRGRAELFVSWEPPDVPLGRISRYDLSMDNKVIYSGTELNYTVQRLTPNTEYTFTVSAITNEGKCESKPAKKRTAKDEFDGDRAPLYQPPARRHSDHEDPSKALHNQFKKQRRRSSIQENQFRGQPGRISSATSLRKSKTSPLIELSQKSDSKLNGSKNMSSVQESQRKNSVSSSCASPAPPADTTEKSSTPTTEIHVIKNNMEEKSQKKPASPCEITNKTSRPPKVTREKTKIRSSNSLSRSADSADLSKLETSSETKSVHFSTDVDKPKSGRPHHSRSNSSGSVKTPTNLEPLKHTSSQRTANVENTLIEELNKRWPKRTRPDRNQASLDSVITGRGLGDIPSTVPSHSNSSVRSSPGKLARQKTIAVPYHRDKTITEPPPGIVPTHNSFFPDSDWLAHVHRPGLKRALERLPSKQGPVNMQIAHQWSPELPSSQAVRNHSKFIPTQFRTQPANLPGGLQRQSTNAAILEAGVRNSYQAGKRWDPMSRSHTTIEFASNRHQTHLDFSSQNRFGASLEQPAEEESRQSAIRLDRLTHQQVSALSAHTSQVSALSPRGKLSSQHDAVTHASA